MCCAELGDFAQAFAHASEAVRCGQILGLTYTLHGAQGFLGFVHLRKGELDHAISILEHELETARTLDLPVLFIHMAYRLGSAYNLSGRVAEALPLLEVARDLAEDTTNMHWGPMVYVHLGEAYALAGRQRDALAVLQRSVHIARIHKQRGYEAWALYMTGWTHALAAPPDSDGAQRYYAEAMALAQKLHMLPLEAQCRFRLGELLAKTGRDRQAREELHLAGEMFSKMESPYWLEKIGASVAAP